MSAHEGSRLTWRPGTSHRFVRVGRRRLRVRVEFQRPQPLRLVASEQLRRRDGADEAVPRLHPTEEEPAAAEESKAEDEQPAMTMINTAAPAVKRDDENEVAKPEGENKDEESYE